MRRTRSGVTPSVTTKATEGWGLGFSPRSSSPKSVIQINFLNHIIVEDLPALRIFSGGGGVAGGGTLLPPSQITKGDSGPEQHWKEHEQGSREL